MDTTSEQEKRLTEAVIALRNSPAFGILESHLKARLEEIKTSLVTNAAAVPNLQGRAQELIATIVLLNRKHK